MPPKKKKKLVQYKPGDRIFAKVKGYPHWPARIEECSDEHNKISGRYPIFFYGTHEVGWLFTRDIFPWEKFHARFGAPKPHKGYNAGLWEAEHDRDVCFGAFAQHKPPSRKSYSLSSEATAPDAADSSLRLDTPLEQTDISQEPTEAEKEALEEVELSMDESEEESNEIEVAPGLSSATRKLSTREKEERREEKQRLRRIEYEKRKKHEVDEQQKQLRLLRLEAALKESVTASSCDVERALLTMDELRTLPMSVARLRQSPGVLRTLAKLLKYKGEEKVKRKAQFVYSHWMNLFLRAACKEKMPPVKAKRGRGKESLQGDTPQVSA